MGGKGCLHSMQYQLKFSNYTLMQLINQLCGANQYMGFSLMAWLHVWVHAWIELIKLVVTMKLKLIIFFQNQHVKIYVQNVYGEDCKEKARLRLSELVPRGGVPLPFLLCTFAHSYFEYIVRNNILWIRISYFYIHFEHTGFFFTCPP